MRITLLLSILLIAVSCSDKDSTQTSILSEKPKFDLVTYLDTIWKMEQSPITTRDSLIKIHGTESEEAAIFQKIYRKNHNINIKKIRHLLDSSGWPEPTESGERGNRTICNVLQHADQNTREHYIPMMKKAVLDKKLEARFLVRAEDRLATDRGQLQIYGGQMKYYPETKSFNVWPVFDPENVDKRRAEIGLGPLDEFLLARFEFKWDLEEQKQRTKAFEERMKKDQH